MEREIRSLAPVTFAEGLMTALDNLAVLTSRTGIDCEFQCGSPVDLIDRATATHPYRIAQESVNDALKHAKAGGIILRLQENDDAVDLTIEDDACGLPTSVEGYNRTGLQVIQYQAKLIGGRLDVHSERGHGVRILRSVPKNR